MGTRGRKKGSTLKSKTTIAPTTDKTETISTRSMMTRRSQTRATEKPIDDLKDSKLVTTAEIEPSRKRAKKTVEKKIEEEEEIVALHDSDDQQMDDNDDQQEVELIRPQVKLEEAKKNEEEESKQIEETARDDQNVGVQTTTIKLVDPPPAEVFTEASLIAEVNQHLLQSSSSNVLTNPLSQDTSSGKSSMVSNSILSA
jgi:PDZ domain-containing secreted protein